MSELRLATNTIAALLQYTKKNLTFEEKQMAECEADYKSGKDSFEFYMCRALAIEKQLCDVRGQVKAYCNCLNILEGKRVTADREEGARS